MYNESLLELIAPQHTMGDGRWAHNQNLALEQNELLLKF
jgi:hypothetical protein